MFAVIKTGGKQYRVQPNDVIEIERLAGDAGQEITFDQVLMLGGDTDTKVGSPVLEGASVLGKVVEQTRGPKIIVFKKKRRKNYRRRNGHRQDLTRVQITDILADGKKKAAKKRAAPKRTSEDQAAAPTAETRAKPASEAKADSKPDSKAKAEAKPDSKAKAKPKARKKADAKNADAKGDDS